MALAKEPMFDDVEALDEDQVVNKTAEEMKRSSVLNAGNDDGMSEANLPKSTFSDNLAAVETEGNGEFSPRFVHQNGGDRNKASDGIVVGGGVGDDEDAASISLTQYYLKGSQQERKTAQNDQDEFMKTLN